MDRMYIRAEKSQDTAFRRSTLGARAASPEVRPTTQWTVMSELDMEADKHDVSHNEKARVVLTCPLRL